MCPGMHTMHTGCRPDSFLGVERKICGLDLVYTLFVGSFYTVDLSQSHFGSFVYAHASDWFFSFLSHMFCPSLSFKTFGMFLAPPVLDLSCIRTLDLHLACFLHLLCWILFVFVHWIFDCFVSVAILWIKPSGVLLLAQALLPVCKYR